MAFLIHSLAPPPGLGYVGAMPDAPLDALSDEALLGRVQRGEAKALGALYDRYAPALLGLAVRMLRSKEAAEDLVHDAFVEAWRSVASFDPSRGSVRAWLVTRVRSRALDRLRAQARSREVAGPEPMEKVSEPSDVNARVDAARVPAWLEALPEAQREALRLAYFEGCSMKEIAERQGVALGTAKARVSRGVARLRAERGAEQG